MEKIINKWKINKSLLAEKMGMTNTTFNKKLDTNNPTEFNDDELLKLKLIMRELYSDLERVIDIDFNCALKKMIKK